MECPECGSTNLTIREYDYGRCRETGYHDAGEMFWCLECGEMGDASDAIVESGETREGVHHDVRVHG
jgi:hypothetical protein